MNDNAEGGIAGVQARTAGTVELKKYHKCTIGYLNERIFGELVDPPAAQMFQGPCHDSAQPLNSTPWR